MVQYEITISDVIIQKSTGISVNKDKLEVIEIETCRDNRKK